MDDKKKNQIKNRIVFIIILCVIFFIGIDLRGKYLEIKEIGENYLSVFLTNLKYIYIMTFSISMFLFVFFSINTRIIKNGLKKFFNEDKKPMPKLPNFSICIIIAIIGGLIGQRFLMESYKLFLNNCQFGIYESIFGNDIGYYIFVLPFIKKVIFYAIGVFVFALLYTAVYYVLALNTYLDGVEFETLKKNTFIKQLIAFTMIIVLLISTLIWIGSQDVLTQEMLSLNDENGTELVGANIADVTIKVWGYRFLSVLIIIDILILFKYVSKGNFKKCVITVSIIPIYLICMFLGLVYLKEIHFKANEFDREKQYIAYNIENTKKAYNIDFNQNELDEYDTITHTEVAENDVLIDNIPLIDKKTLETSINEHQDNSAYYNYNNSHISLYDYDNTQKITYLTPRQIIDSNKSYNNRTFEYTHGYSIVQSSVNEFDKNGYIEYYNYDINDENLKITEPRIYFGTGENNILVTNSKYGNELDYPLTMSINEENVYDGKAGLNLNFFDRLILGLKNRNIKIAFSGYVDKNSKIITNRNIIERAKQILPDIKYDNNPYMVISSEGKLFWVIDGYTMTNKYPYSQSMIAEMPNGEKEKINYIRNSIKVLVNAYDGTIKFYITDQYDPIIASYKKMYPGLFEDNISEDLIKQFIYPQYLYNIQAEIIKIYHDISEDVLYRGEDVWAITAESATKKSEINSYYTMVRTIDKKEYNLGLVVPYTKNNKPNIISYLVGTYDNGKPRLSLYKFKAESNVAGTVQLNNQIEEDELISNQLEAINVTGTKLIKNIFIVPINNTLLYVEPVYQVMLNDKSEVPILKKVIVASGNKVAIGNSLKEAINNLFTDYSVEIKTEDAENIDSVIESIIKANDNLKESMEQNNFELIGKDLGTLQDLINELDKLKQKEKKEKIVEDTTAEANETTE